VRVSIELVFYTAPFTKAVFTFKVWARAHWVTWQSVTY